MFGRLMIVAVLLLTACGRGNAAPAQPERAAEPTAFVTALAAPPAAAPTPTPTPAVPQDPAPTVTPEATSTPAPIAEPTAEPTPTAERATPQPEPTVAGPSCRVIDDFAETTGRWQLVLDGVMGGRSSGQATILDGTLTLTGTINTNGGGFVMVRRQIEPADIGDATSLKVVANTDGRGYEVMLSDALPGRSRSVSHFATIDFGNDASDMAVGTVALADLQTRSFGTPILTEPFRPDMAFSIGVILSDGVDGDFVMTVDRIEACR